MEEVDAVRSILKRIYGEEHADIAFKKILTVIEKFSLKQKTKEKNYFSQEDIV